MLTQGQKKDIFSFFHTYNYVSLFENRESFFFKYITIILRYKHLLRKTENTYYKCQMFGLSIWRGIKSQNFWHFDIQIAKSLHFLNLTP